jgi:hypothetical protein
VQRPTPEKNTQTDLPEDYLESVSEFVCESEGVSAAEEPAPRPSAAMPAKEKDRDQEITDAAERKNGNDIQIKSEAPAPKPSATIRAGEKGRDKKILPAAESKGGHNVQVKSRTPAPRGMGKKRITGFETAAPKVIQKRFYRNKWILRGSLAALAIVVLYVFLSRFPGSEKVSGKKA